MTGSTGVETLTVLVVEDSPADADLVVEALADAEGEFHFENAESLDEALSRLERDGLDVVLLDLSLPDSQGLDTLARLRARAPAVPVVILSGLDDAELAARAVAVGAQDYLVKGRVDGSVLARTLTHAVGRARASGRRRRDQQEREIRSLEDLVGPSGDGSATLSRARPGAFADLSRRYSDLVEVALRHRVHASGSPSAGLRALADQLGRLDAGPRDAVEVHTAVMRGYLEAATPEKAEACLDEGRVMLLEMMGYLVSHYRGRATVSR